MFNHLKATLNNVISKLRDNAAMKKINQMRGEWRKVINWLGSRLNGCGVSANLATLLGFAIGLLAINFLAMQMYLAALVCILLNRFFDAIDGAIARCSAVTDFGIFLDATLDYIFYAGVIWGFALAYPAQNAVAAGFLLFGFAASACAMLAYAAAAGNHQQLKKLSAEQSPFYLGGLAQGAETFVALVVLCLVPGWFMPIAIVLGCWCLAKALMVISAAYYNFVIAPKGHH